MDQFELIKHIEELKEKLNKSMRKAEGLKQKSKVLESQYQDSRQREKNTNDLVMELLQRQKELNVMLNRANVVLNRMHETMALTSVEFNEMAKALPEPKKAEWSDRVSKINELFKKTGAQDAELVEDEPAKVDPEPEPFVGQPEITIHVSSDEAQESRDDEPTNEPAKKTWWSKISSGNT